MSSIAIHSIKTIGHYLSTSETDFIFDIGYLFEGCKGELSIVNDIENDIYLWNEQDKKRLNESLRHLIVKPLNNYPTNYTIYIEPSNKMVSFLNGIGGRFKIGDGEDAKEYQMYQYVVENDIKTLNTNSDPDNNNNNIIIKLNTLKTHFKKRCVYNDRTLYVDPNSNNISNIFFKNTINLVGCNIYGITDIYDTMYIDETTNIMDFPSASQTSIFSETNSNTIIESFTVPSDFSDIIETGKDLTYDGKIINVYSNYVWVKKKFDGIVYFDVTITISGTSTTHRIYLKYDGNIKNILNATLIEDSILQAFLEDYRDKIDLNTLDESSYIDFITSYEKMNLDDINVLPVWFDICEEIKSPKIISSEQSQGQSPPSNFSQKQNVILGNNLYKNFNDRESTVFNGALDTAINMKNFNYFDKSTNMLRFKYLDRDKDIRVFNVISRNASDRKFYLNDRDVTTNSNLKYISFYFGRISENNDLNASLDLYNSSDEYLITVSPYHNPDNDNDNIVYMKFTDKTKVASEPEYSSIILQDVTIVSINGYNFNVHPFYGPIDPEDINHNEVYLYKHYENDFNNVLKVKGDFEMDNLVLHFDIVKPYLKYDLLQLKNIDNNEVNLVNKVTLEYLRYFELLKSSLVLNYYLYGYQDINNHLITNIDNILTQINRDGGIQNIQIDSLNKSLLSLTGDVQCYFHFTKYILDDIYSGYFQEKANSGEVSLSGIFNIFFMFSSITFNLNEDTYICFQDPILDGNGDAQKYLLKTDYRITENRTTKDGIETISTENIKKYMIQKIQRKKYYSTIYFIEDDLLREIISFKFNYYVTLFKFPFVKNNDNLQVEHNKVLYINTNDDGSSSQQPGEDENTPIPIISNTVYFHVRGDIKIEQMNDPIILKSEETNIYDRIFGNNHIVSIQNPDTHVYNGFLKCNGLNSSLTIKIDNLHVEVDSKFINQGQGLIVSKDATLTEITASSGQCKYIQRYGGGLVGSGASNCEVKYSYSNADIHQGAGGIFGRGASDCKVYGSYSMGEIIMGGGIFGNNARDCESEFCYTTGKINAGSGGIYGSYAQKSKSIDSYSTSEEVYPLSGTVYGNYAMDCSSSRGIFHTDVDICRNIVDTDTNYLDLKTSTSWIGSPNVDSINKIQRFGAFGNNTANDDIIDSTKDVFDALKDIYNKATHTYPDQNGKGDGYDYPIWYLDVSNINPSTHIFHRGTYIRKKLRHYQLHSFSFANPDINTEIFKLVKENNVRSDTIHNENLLIYENIDITGTSFKYTGVDPDIKEEHKNAKFVNNDDPTNVYIAVFLNVFFDSLSFVLPDNFIVLGTSGNACIFEIGGDPDHIRNYIQPLIISVFKIDETNNRKLILNTGIDIIDKNTFESNYKEYYTYLKESGVTRDVYLKNFYKNGRLQLYLNDCYFVFNPYFYIFDGMSHTIDFSNNDVIGLFSNEFNYDTDTMIERPQINHLKITNGKTKIGGGFIVKANSKYIQLNSCTSNGEINDEGGGLFGKGCENCKAINCYSTGKINHGGGGIFGAESKNCEADTCYSSGEIVEGGGGIIGMENEGSVIRRSFSTGKIGPFSGGLIGSFSSSPYFIEKCYTTGDIMNSAGGFIGAYTDYQNFETNTGSGTDDNFFQDYTKINESIISYSYVSGTLNEYSSYFYGAGSFYNLSKAFKYVYTTTNELLTNTVPANISSNPYNFTEYAPSNTHAYNTIQSFILDEGESNENNNTYGNDFFKDEGEPDVNPLLYNQLRTQFKNNGFVSDTFGTVSYIMLYNFIYSLITFKEKQYNVWKNYFHYNASPILFYEFALINNDVDIFAPLLLETDPLVDSLTNNNYSYTVKFPNYQIDDSESIKLSKDYAVTILSNPLLNNPLDDTTFIDYNKSEILEKYFLFPHHTITLLNYHNRQSVLYESHKTPYHFTYSHWMYPEIYKDEEDTLIETLANGDRVKNYSMNFGKYDNDLTLELSIHSIKDYDKNDIIEDIKGTSGTGKLSQYYIAAFYEHKCVFYIPLYTPTKSTEYMKMKINHTETIKLNDSKLQFLLYNSETVQLIPIFISSIKRNSVSTAGNNILNNLKFVQEGWKNNIVLDTEDPQYGVTDLQKGYKNVNDLSNFMEYFDNVTYTVSFNVYYKYYVEQYDNNDIKMVLLDYDKNRNTYDSILNKYKEDLESTTTTNTRFYFSKSKITKEDIKNNFINKVTFLKNDVLMSNEALLDSNGELEKYKTELKNNKQINFDTFEEK